MGEFRKYAESALSQLARHLDFWRRRHNMPDSCNYFIQFQAISFAYTTASTRRLPGKHPPNPQALTSQPTPPLHRNSNRHIPSHTDKPLAPPRLHDPTQHVHQCFQRIQHPAPCIQHPAPYTTSAIGLANVKRHTYQDCAHAELDPHVANHDMWCRSCSTQYAKSAQTHRPAHTIKAAADHVACSCDTTTSFAGASVRSEIGARLAPHDDDCCR